jgi:hypothetical protein
LKNRAWEWSTDGDGNDDLLQTWLTFCSQTLIENFPADFDFYFTTGL